MLNDDKNVDRDLFFREKDPFNHGNEIECYLSRETGRYYGSMELVKVNGEELRNNGRIFATPKLEFPFNMNANYIWPSAEEIITYRKYDGTNVFMYPYQDATGRRYISYKVRLFPFLRVRFLTLWRRILKQYPNLPKLVDANVQNIPNMMGYSFEMYGADNPHLIKYDEPALDIALLFGIRGNGEVVPHHELETMNIPCAEFCNIAGPDSHRISEDYVWHYEQQKQNFTDLLETVPEPEMTNEELVQFRGGDEGSVWYLKDKRTELWRMYKCKADQIQSIHWENRSVPEIIIQATAQNALETQDVLTEEVVISLLKEEFSAQAIEVSKIRIAKVIATMNGELELDEKIKSLLHDLDIVVGMPTLKLTVPDIMRALSHHFPKSMMRKVHARIMMILEC